MNTWSRRSALALVLAHAAWAFGCGSGPARPAEPPTGPALKLAPLADLVAAAGLEWLVLLEPKPIAAAPETTLAIAELFPNAPFDAFAERHGVDLRAVDELAVAGYADTRLVLARGFVDPARVERAFSARTLVDRRHLEAGGVLLVDGRVGATPERLVVFGPRGAAIERGKAGPLRAARLFAEQKLKRARPALGAEPLAKAATFLGGPWLGRAFFPGPFGDDWAKGAGGLFRTATSVAIGARPAIGPEPGGRLELVLVVTGDFEDAAGAKARLGATLDRLMSSDIGRLVGADQPAEPLRVDMTPEGLRARIVLRATQVFRGLHVATGASAEEIFGRP